MTAQQTDNTSPPNTPTATGAKAHSVPSLVTIAVTAALISGAMLVWALVWMHHQERKQADELGTAFAQVVEEQTARTFQAIDLRLQLAADTLAHARSHGVSGRNTAQTLLAISTRDLPFVRAIWILDAQGIVTDRSDSEQVGLDFSDRPFFQYFKSGTHTKLYIGEPVRSRISGKWLIHVARPIFSIDGIFLGVMVAGLEPLYFDALWKNIALQNDGSVALWRDDAKLMMRSPMTESLLGKDYSDLPLFSPPLNKLQVGAFENEGLVQGDARLLHFRRVSDYPNLIILVGQAKSAMFAHWRQMAALTALLWVFGSVGLIALAQSLQRSAIRKQQTDLQRHEVFERITDAFVAVDTQWRYNFVNAQASAIMGYTQEQLIGKSMWAPELNNDVPEFRRACEAAMLQQNQVHVEVQFAPSGRWFDNHIYPSPEGLTIYFRETTAQKEAAVQLQTLSRRVLEAQEAERRRIAHELHDELGQSLTAIKINLQAGAAFGSDQQEKRNPRSIEIIEAALQHVRNLSLALRPSVLDDLGLRAALEWLVETAAQTSAMDIQLTSNLDDRRLDGALETACFRVVQEALTNIQRHAKAAHVRVDLTVNTHSLHLTVHDDGQGFNTDRPKALAAKSLGLLGMRERAELVGGKLTLTSSEGQGCVVSMECPITPEVGAA